MEDKSIYLLCFIVLIIILCILIGDKEEEKVTGHYYYRHTPKKTQLMIQYRNKRGKLKIREATKKDRQQLNNISRRQDF